MSSRDFWHIVDFSDEKKFSLDGLMEITNIDLTYAKNYIYCQRGSRKGFGHGLGCIQLHLPELNYFHKRPYGLSHIKICWKQNYCNFHKI